MQHSLHNDVPMATSTGGRDVPSGCVTTVASSAHSGGSNGSNSSGSGIGRLMISLGGSGSSGSRSCDVPGRDKKKLSAGHLGGGGRGVAVVDEEPVRRRSRGRVRWERLERAVVIRCHRSLYSS